MKELNRTDTAESIYETIYLELNSLLYRQTVPTFWRYFDEQCDNSREGFDKFQIGVKYLFREHRKYQSVINRVKLFKHLSHFKRPELNNRNDQDYFNHMFKSCLLSQLPNNFSNIINRFYEIVFRVLVAMSGGGSDDTASRDDMVGTDCGGCESVRENCRCDKLMKIFGTTNAYLTEMDLLDRLAGQSLIELIQDRITAYVRETCQGSADTSHLERLEKWLHTNVFKWLAKLFVVGSVGETEGEEEDEGRAANDTMDNFKYKFTYHLFEIYAHTIIDQFFNIIIDYPDSKPSIDDLKICLVKIDLRNHLTATVKRALETRLLHPGVDTGDVLTGYVAAIKALRHLDSSGVLLEVITEPVKEYLKARTDTVRTVVTALTEEGPTDLAEELAKGETTKGEIKATAGDDMTNWETWMPDPVDANPKKSSRSSRTADIISMVINIYGSKEVFVNEYRNLLAERLLLNLDFNIEKEIRNLELLKLRFGEQLLHNCEVMLKDISDSKRINAHIHGAADYTADKSFEMSTLIVSSQFWPAFRKETIELPDEIKAQFERYAKSYEAYKGNRTLNWNTFNGRVELEIEFANKRLELSVTTIQATIIMHFQRQSEWQLDRLSQVMKIPPSILRKKINFWQSQGFIKERTDDIFYLADETMDDTMEDLNQSHDICEDDEADSAMASTSDQREEEFKVFWSYIEGMLFNLDSLPLDRIHQMLKMFAAQDPGMDFSQQELKNFLQRKVKEQKLVFAAGVYYLPK